MMLTSDSETLAENKVLILYILEKLGKPTSNDSLLNLVLAVTDMNYFYFQQFLLDLLEKKYIVIFENENTTFYDITEEGRKTLKLTENIVPGILKLKVDSNFKEELNTYTDSHSVVAEFTPTSENEYTVKCKIIDNDKTIFEISTFAGSDKQAKEIVNNWNKNADKLYPELIKVLTTNNNNNNSSSNTKDINNKDKNKDKNKIKNKIRNKKDRKK